MISPNTLRIKRKKNSHVLVVTPQYAPDYGPSVPIFTMICEDLIKYGYQVTVITAIPKYHDQNTLNIESTKVVQEEVRNGVRLIRIKVYLSKRTKGPLHRIMHFLSFNVLSAITALKISNCDAMIVDSPALFSGFITILNSLFNKVPYIYVVHDIYPDILAKIGVLTQDKLPYRVINLIEKRCMKKAKYVSVLSKGFKQNIIRKGIDESKIKIIPICVDTNFMKLMHKDNHILNKWKLEGKFVVLYAGNIGFSQGLEIMVYAAEKLRYKYQIQFVIVGEGEFKHKLIIMAREKGLKNIKFFPYEPEENVPEIYGVSDVCIVSLRKEIAMESIPSKMYTIMAAEKPVIAAVDSQTEVAEIVKQTGCGRRIEPEDHEALAEHIMDLYRNSKLSLKMGMNGRKFVVRWHSRMVLAKLYSETLSVITYRN